MWWVGGYLQSQHLHFGSSVNDQEGEEKVEVGVAAQLTA